MIFLEYSCSDQNICRCMVKYGIFYCIIFSCTVILFLHVCCLMFVCLFAYSDPPPPSVSHQMPQASGGSKRLQKKEKKIKLEELFSFFLSGEASTAHTDLWMWTNAAPQRKSSALLGGRGGPAAQLSLCIHVAPTREPRKHTHTHLHKAQIRRHSLDTRPRSSDRTSEHDSSPVSTPPPPKKNTSNATKADCRPHVQCFILFHNQISLNWILIFYDWDLNALQKMTIALLF